MTCKTCKGYGVVGDVRTGVWGERTCPDCAEEYEAEERADTMREMNKDD